NAGHAVQTQKCLEYLTLFGTREREKAFRSLSAENFFEKTLEKFWRLKIKYLPLCPLSLPVGS
ncbi:hypothetical protein, partial [Bacteroides caecigallinarum]|uniref:hypothetical protein n=1 Tax=Bacteroides caecigallinarum TaxID=1411144 RepID=UPI00195613F5